MHLLLKNGDFPLSCKFCGGVSVYLSLGKNLVVGGLLLNLWHILLVRFHSLQSSKKATSLRTCLFTILLCFPRFWSTNLQHFEVSRNLSATKNMAHPKQTTQRMVNFGGLDWCFGILTVPLSHDPMNLNHQAKPWALICARLKQTEDPENGKPEQTGMMQTFWSFHIYL